MSGSEEIKNLTVNIVANYDERITVVGEIIEKGLAMLDQCRRAQKIVQNELKETLAKVESLRKKDFDFLMMPLLGFQETKEQEIREFVNRFLKKQKESASQLKRLIQTDILEKVPEVEMSIQGALEEAKRYLLQFQKEQAFIGEKIQTLSSRKEALTVKEFKQAMESLQETLGLKRQKGGECLWDLSHKI